MSRQVLTSTYLHGIVDRYADLAQLAERIHGKDEDVYKRQQKSDNEKK